MTSVNQEKVIKALRSEIENLKKENSELKKELSNLEDNVKDKPLETSEGEKIDPLNNLEKEI